MSDTTGGLTATKEVSLYEGELPCLLVYSDSKHVSYINEILSVTEDSIRKHGFKPQRLSKEIRSGQDYLTKISCLIDSCALVVIILDGLRPNVVFEFGYAKARRKPIVVIRSKDSVISIKTLYETINYSGLSAEEFIKLKEPQLNPTSHLSDFAGKHVSVIDRAAKETDDNHLSIVLKKELTHQISTVLKEIQLIKIKNIDPSILKEALPYLTKIISLYSTEIEYGLDELKTAFEEIRKVSQKHQQDMPEEVGDMVGSTFIRKANQQVDRHDGDSAAQYYAAALEVFENLLSAPSLKTNSKLYGTVNDKAAYVHLQLYGLLHERTHLIKAIDLFLISLTVNTPINYALDYGIIKSNIALAYHKLALLEDFDRNSKKAIEAFNEARRIYTIESHPLQYAGICNNLGNVYKDLGAVYYQTQADVAIQNWQLAIDCYSESLKIFIENHPSMRAALLNTRGAMYQNLAMMDLNVKENSDLALDDFKESLEIWTIDKFPHDHAIVKYNIGVTYMKLYGVERREEARQHSITSLKKAADMFNKNSIEYYDSQFNLGNIYMPLEKTDYTVSDCRNAIDSYLASLEGQKDKLSFHYAMTWYSIGLIYSKLMHLEDKEKNYEKMIDAFANSLVIITETNYPRIYRSIQNIIRINRI